MCRLWCWNYSINICTKCILSCLFFFLAKLPFPGMYSVQQFCTSHMAYRVKLTECSCPGSTIQTTSIQLGQLRWNYRMIHGWSSFKIVCHSIPCRNLVVRATERKIIALWLELDLPLWDHLISWTCTWKLKIVIRYRKTWSK